MELRCVAGVSLEFYSGMGGGLRKSKSGASFRVEHARAMCGAIMEKTVVRTINEVFYNVVERTLDQVLLYKTKQAWTPMSTAELYSKVVGTARALTSFGVGMGDRVAILSENRPEW